MDLLARNVCLPVIVGTRKRNEVIEQIKIVSGGQGTTQYSPGITKTEGFRKFNNCLINFELKQRPFIIKNNFF